MSGSERRISGAGVSHDPEASPRTGAPGVSAEQSIAAERVPLYDTDRVWTLPNALSFLRLAGVPLVLWLILGPQADGLAVLVLALGGLTDWLDGYLARAWHQTSRIGQMLDPIADRLYILAVLVGLALREIVPWWLAVIIVGRDVFVVVLVPILKTRGYSSLPCALRGQGCHFLPAVRVPACAAWLGPAGMASAGVGVGLGIRHLGHHFVLVRRRPLPSSDRQAAPLHATDPRRRSL